MPRTCWAVLLVLVLSGIVAAQTPKPPFTAQDAEGLEIRFKAGGLLARAIQHETDHLNGILFIDRMPTKAKQAIKPELDELQAATKAALKKNS